MSEHQPSLKSVVGLLSAISNNVDWQQFTSARLSEVTRMIQRGEGAREFEHFLRGEPVVDPLVPSYDPETGIYRFEVNYDEPIASKMASQDLRRPGWGNGNFIDDIDEMFPDDHSGRKVVIGRIKYFGPRACHGDLRRWVERHDKVFARPKELLDFSRAFVSSMLNTLVLPLAAPGQCWRDPDRSDRYPICLSLQLDRRGDERDLRISGMNGEWTGDWRFLVLDKPVDEVNK